MVTKESLIEARESINEAMLKIKQQYSNEDKAKKVIIIVEGKDDIPYYGVKTSQYQQDGYKVSVIPAGNRKKVIATYDQIDWNRYSKSRILFVVDRDLSDYTLERTPQDENVYVTDKYAIENELCTFTTFLNTLKFYCGLNDINDFEEEELRRYYLKLCQDFYNIMDPIMGVILYWKVNGVQANYANLNCSSFLRINEMELTISDELKKDNGLLEYFFRMSGEIYDHTIDVEYYIAQLKERATPEHYVRGKYLLSFFVCLINYTARNSDVILSSNRKGRMTISIGPKDAIPKLCGLMPIPKTLNDFFAERFATV